MNCSSRCFRRVSAGQRSQWRSFTASPRRKASTPSSKPSPARNAPRARTGSNAPRRPPKPSRKHAESTSHEPPPPPPDTLLSLWRRSWIPLVGASLVAGYLGFYLVGTTTATLRPCPSCSNSPPSPSDTDSDIPTGRPPALTGSNALTFDTSLDTPEYLTGITSLRKRLAAHATGHVLELAVGSGRNLAYYDWEPLTSAVEGRRPRFRKPGEGRGVVSWTGLDVSVDMLDVAREKLVKNVPPMRSSEPVVKAASMSDRTGGQLSYLGGFMRLIHADAHNPLPAPPSFPSSPTQSQTQYDTILQTFGLCSVSSPAKILHNLAASITPDTGRIYLLEHGLGWYGLVNGLLDKNARSHFDKYGCWWNRDIQGIVEDAVKSTPGLEVVKIERPKVLQMGTLVWVELKVSSEKMCDAVKQQESQKTS